MRTKASEMTGSGFSPWTSSGLLYLSLLLIASCSGQPQRPGNDAGADAEVEAEAEPDAPAEADVDDAGPETGDAEADTDIDGGARPPFRECVGRDFTAEFTGRWEHGLISPIVASGQPGHSVEDLILTTPAPPTEVEGKFAYGQLSKDLEDEWVAGFVDDCTGWQELGTELTDTDGRARFSVPASILERPGRYEVRLVVQGDGTQTWGYLLVVPPATQFVVFDIDGTLTTSDFELVQELFLDLFAGDYVPEAYEGARDAVAACQEAGYEVLFLTGRPYWLAEATRGWLEELGFTSTVQPEPEGSPRLATLHLTRTNGEALPTEAGVGTYKLDFLRHLLDEGHTLRRAYGNATTDVYAYVEAPLPLEDVFIIGANAGVDGTQPLSSYPEHLAESPLPPADQPFER